MGENVPTVSIIVPNYNHAPYLQQRMDSILEQTYQDFELILLDDYSTDGSREMLEGYLSHPKVSHLVCNDTNSGSAFHQWDKGLALAQGEWVWIAESDDWADPSFLEQALAAATTDKECVLTYTSSICEDAQGTPLWDTPSDGAINRYTGKDFILHKLLYANVITNVSACLFRRSCYHPAESVRYEKMHLCGDWMFYVLLAEQGTVFEIRKPLNHCRRHGANIAEKAEKDGLTLLEGADILNYVIAHYGVKEHVYAHTWGRTWHKYHKKYHFTPAIERAIFKRYLHAHPSIVLYRILYYLCRR